MDMRQSGVCSSNATKDTSSNRPIEVYLGGGKGGGGDGGLGEGGGLHRQT